MSRNLCRTNCDNCGSEHIRLTGEIRPITRNDAGVYFDEFEGMLVAPAMCRVCAAKYLAWVDQRPCVNPIHRDRAIYCSEDAAFFDLSYRSSFDDEPRDDDIPYVVVAHNTGQIVETIGDGMVVVNIIETIMLRQA